MIERELRKLLEQQTLDRGEACRTLDVILHGDVPEAQTVALLSLLQLRGPTAAEVAGFADSLAAAALPFPGEVGDAIDTCGTGGDGSSTFNLSTTAGLLAAACGATVLKHGNRAATSRSGSADLLEALGIPIDLDPAAAAHAAARHRFAFLYARSYHPVMARVAPLRSQIGFPTVFNLLGPLLNPARVTRQVVGVYSAPLQRRMADALALRGCKHALVLHGAGGLDEATPIGPFECLCVRDGRVTEEVRDPADVGLPRCLLSDLQVSSPEESRRMAEAVLRGEPGPPRDAVVLNAGLALEVAGEVPSFREGVERARRQLDSGKTWSWLQALRTNPGAPS